MIQVDLPAAFAVGQIYAFLSRKYLKKTPELFTNKLTGPLNLYVATGFIPTGMYLMVGWPSWEAMYVTDWVENTFNRPLVAAFYVLFMVSMMILGNVGFVLAHYCYLKGKDKFVVYGSVLGVLLTLLPFLLRWGIWMQIGTYAQVKANTGYSFFQAPFFTGWLFFISYIAIATVLTGVWFSKKGNNL